MLQVSIDSQARIGKCLETSLILVHYSGQTRTELTLHGGGFITPILLQRTSRFDHFYDLVWNWMDTSTSPFLSTLPRLCRTVAVQVQIVQS